MANNGAGTQTSLDLEGGLYRIGDVSRMTGVKAFVLRYWETEFPMLEPEKRANGRRFYREEDVEMIRKIKRLLYDEGFTIAGARRHLAYQRFLENQWREKFGFIGTPVRWVQRMRKRNERESQEEE